MQISTDPTEPCNNACQTMHNIYWTGQASPSSPNIEFSFSCDVVTKCH